MANKLYRVAGRIMTEVWTIELGLVVPRVEEWVNKSTSRIIIRLKLNNNPKLVVLQEFWKICLKPF